MQQRRRKKIRVDGVDVDYEWAPALVDPTADWPVRQLLESLCDRARERDHGAAAGIG